MSYYHAAPPSPTSSADSFSSNPPHTPTDYITSIVLPSLPDFSSSTPHTSTDYTPFLVPWSLPGYPDAQKRPQNTTERRASHNAAERARRETLNSRFLVSPSLPLPSPQLPNPTQDLAALLPNLKHLRRPSKSAIVNSSIAHARAARRYRLLASAHLRALNAECESVRRELNAWRARAGVCLAAAPVRSEGFALVLSGEEPAFDPADLDAEDECEEEWGRRRRAPAPSEPACEGTLLLSHPYAKPPTPTPTPSPTLFARRDTNPHLNVSPRAHPQMAPSHPHLHTPNMNTGTPHPPARFAVDVGALLLPSQGEQWVYAPQGQMW
ncbi:hypothetical protein B0H13DRAFT_1902780 [Mycena leptocephala]|nr:hypothetical protein B0H13DRAFT_1902780 [Mycena leptocephala]